jgi:hypothetical protein
MRSHSEERDPGDGWSRRTDRGPRTNCLERKGDNAPSPPVDHKTLQTSLCMGGFAKITAKFARNRYFFRIRESRGRGRGAVNQPPPDKIPPARPHRVQHNRLNTKALRHEPRDRPAPRAAAWNAGFPDTGIPVTGLCEHWPRVQESPSQAKIPIPPNLPVLTISRPFPGRVTFRHESWLDPHHDHVPKQPLFGPSPLGCEGYGWSPSR